MFAPIAIPSPHIFHIPAHTFRMVYTHTQTHKICMHVPEKAAAKGKSTKAKDAEANSL